MTVSPDAPGRTRRRLPSLAVYLPGPAALAALWYLRSAGLVADTPIVGFAIVLAVGAVANFATSLLLAARPDSTVCLHARVAASALTTSAVIYAVGWGSLLLVAFAVGSSELLRTAGSATYRPNLWWNVVALGAGEVAIELGVAPTVVEPALAHAIAVTGIVLLAVVTKVLGDSARATEEAEQLIGERARHFEALIAHASDLIGVVDSDGIVVSVNPAVTTMLGLRPDEVVGRRLAELVANGSDVDVDAALRRAAAEPGGAFEFELRLRHADGIDRLTVTTLTRPGADWGDRMVFNVHDITTQRELEVQLRHDARHDALTGLLNRKAFGEVSERACARAATTGGVVGMLYIDLDGFKIVNDSLGHDAGDRVLVEAGSRIRSCLSSGETLARLGGDEFAVLIDPVAPGRGVQLAEAILTAVGAPIDGLPDEMRVGASIGIALRSVDGIEFASLLSAADAAMYAAKRNGRARWEMTLPEDCLRSGAALIEI